MTRLRAVLVFVLLCASLVSAPAVAQVTNFSRDVATSIDRGLAWMDVNGGFNNPSAAGDSAGLTALALLEKRASADQNAAPTGYQNATPADRGRLDRVMTYIINRSQGAGFYAYRDGADLMALSVYLRSGGPNQAGALSSIRSVFDRVSANQNGGGYWCYNNGGCNDSSTTQLTMAGLAAARGVFNDPAYADAGRLARLNQMTALTAQGYQNNARGGDLGGGEIGHSYSAGGGPSMQQTASGLWCLIIGGFDLNNGTVQGYLRFLRNRYNFRNIYRNPESWSIAYYYYMWSSAKAYTFLEDSGVMPAPGNLSTADLGNYAPNLPPAEGSRQMRYNPNAVARAPQFGGEGAGYYASPFEPARWYFDYAYWLINNQPGGYFDTPDGGDHWDSWADQAFALLVLERSVGGGCNDSDDDGTCDFEDNCPQVDNDNQSDGDGDGVGDVCDNCPAANNNNQADGDADGRGNACDNCPGTPNGNQVDVDNDGIGDACDAIICIPSGPEVCDGVDNDCDGVVDEGNPGGDALCNPGAIGICAQGVTACRAGQLVCLQVFNPAPDGCNGLDDDCDGAVDEGNPGGDVPCATGALGACGEGTTACLAGQVLCVPTFDPRAEVCDGVDNDCDGDEDEDNPEGDQACDTGALGVCFEGRSVCDRGRLLCMGLNVPDAEVCNGADDDCDGAIDDGDPQGGVVCATGQAGACSVGVSHCVNGAVACVPDNPPRAEVCNGLDDDCDGAADDGNPGGDQRCDTGQRGVCADGRTACRNGEVACDRIGQPGVELCNGLDDDCDGSADEGLPIGQPCRTDLPGVCVDGRFACNDGALECAPIVGQSVEFCDGLDNDCDGLTDDDIEGLGDVCATGDRGVCARGRLACEGGGQSCVADETPSDERCDRQDDDCDGVIDEGLRNACGVCGALPAESCDGLDNDCNGTIDDGAPCPGETLCRGGRCVDPCVNNECPENTECIAGACVGPCDLVTCPASAVCRGGECVDRCAGVTCPSGQACARGECVEDNCYAAGCAEGERCVDSVCVADPCSGVTCELDSFCREGRCVSSCAEVSCRLGEVCRDGACVADACGGVECAAGQACVDGACQVDACEGIACGPGQRCEGGLCAGDPCNGIVCPPGEACGVSSDGSAQCVADWAPVDDPNYRPDGGTSDAGATTQDARTGGGQFEEVPSDFGVDNGAASGDAGPEPPQAAEQVSGCACRTPGTGPAAAWPLLLLVVPALRRRRRGR